MWGLLQPNAWTSSVGPACNGLCQYVLDCFGGSPFQLLWQGCKSQTRFSVAPCCASLGASQKRGFPPSCSLLPAPCSLFPAPFFFPAFPQPSKLLVLSTGIDPRTEIKKRRHRVSTPLSNRQVKEIHSFQTHPPLNPPPKKNKGQFGLNRA